MISEKALTKPEKVYVEKTFQTYHFKYLLQETRYGYVCILTTENLPITFFIPIPVVDHVSIERLFSYFSPLPLKDLFSLLKKWGERFIGAHNKELFLIQEVMNNFPTAAGSFLNHGMTMLIHHKNAWNLTEKFLWSYKMSSPKSFQSQVHNSYVMLTLDPSSFSSSLIIRTFEESLLISKLKIFEKDETRYDWADGFYRTISLQKDFALKYPQGEFKKDVFSEINIEPIRFEYSIKFQVINHFIALKIPISRFISQDKLRTLIRHFKIFCVFYNWHFDGAQLSNILYDYFINYKEKFDEFKVLSSNPTFQMLVHSNENDDATVFEIKKFLFTSIFLSLKDITISSLPHCHLIYNVSLFSILQSHFTKPYSFYSVKYATSDEVF